ncbi:hypothetical protein BDV33DRAFT_200703 [Aspergillus novoparasiticus]|uniref:Polyketide synthase n=1 Tax=Aspergillus novoparasiticus TaxID=986946 RepID=A0A5N6EZZ3_9EURO|nr:hypothetical protein BDV33DRAFT_200703 [Aspergillus novoparasiticus]
MEPATVKEASPANGLMADREPLAIVGLSARFAQEARNVEQFWNFLLRARQASTPVPRDRFNHSSFYHPDPDHRGTTHVQGAHFLEENSRMFDAGFFKMSKSEVLCLDPQQRLVMENVYHALENAGLPMEKIISSNTSVFVSGFNRDQQAIASIDPSMTFRHRAVGENQAIIANRISWFYDLKGPSLVVDTACSSSMVALHLATQSLQSGESDMAIVSGVSVLNHVTDFLTLTHSSLLGAQGKCFSFDHRAEGYARGEGVGTVIIKPLSHALKDGDTIRAILRGTAVNQDGRTQGITNPSAKAQQRLIEGLYSRLRLDPDDTMLVEAHGTGTQAGDPIEAAGIAGGFKAKQRKRPLYIGAVKSGIGHLEGGAAIAAIIKSVLVLENGIIPPNVNFEKVNPDILKDEWNLEFPTKNMPWPTQGQRRISINSFGFGGTNGHCIIDDAYHFLRERGLVGYHNTITLTPTATEVDRLVRQAIASYEDSTPDGKSTTRSTRESDTTSSSSSQGENTSGRGVENNEVVKAIIEWPYRPRLFVLSGSDRDGLERVQLAICNYLRGKLLLSRKDEESVLNRLAFTLSDRRSRLFCKSYVVAASVKELQEEILDERFLSRAMISTRGPLLTIVFIGQGAQYARMGQGLLGLAVFRNSLMEASQYFLSLGCDWSLLEELIQDPQRTRVDSPEISQPLCTALQVALLDLLHSWNIVPTCVVGHSSGEIAAAYAAGKITRERAWSTAYYRGYISSKLSHKGAMLAVLLDHDSLSHHMRKVAATSHGDEHLNIACFNGPSNNTVSGDTALIDLLKHELDRQGISSRKLSVQNPYHSPYMQEIATEYLRLMDTITDDGLPAVTHNANMYSTVTGHKLNEPTISNTYWVENLVRPVKFADALQSALSDHLSHSSGPLYTEHIVELGPHPALRNAIDQIRNTSPYRGRIQYSPSLVRGEPDLGSILNMIGNLAINSHSIDITHINSCTTTVDDISHCKVLADLPPYPFKHDTMTSYDSRLTRNFRDRPLPTHEILGTPVIDWKPDYPTWRHFLSVNELPWLKDHKIANDIVFPGAGYLLMAIEALRMLDSRTLPVRGFRFRTVAMRTALTIPDNEEGVEISFSMQATSGSDSKDHSAWKVFRIMSYSYTHDSWVEHCTGEVRVVYQRTAGSVDAGRVDRQRDQAWLKMIEQGVDSCDEPMPTKLVYDMLEDMGHNFGPLFRNLHDVHATGHGRGEVAGRVMSPDIKGLVTGGNATNSSIHPVCLDTVLHAALVAILDSSALRSRQARAIASINEAWISSDVQVGAGASLSFYHQALYQGSSIFKCQINAWSTSDEGQGTLQFSGLQMVPIAGAVPNTNSFYHTIEWVPDVHLLEMPSRVAATIDSEYVDERKESLRNAELLTVLLVTDALEALKALKPGSLEGHWVQFHEWMQHVLVGVMTNQNQYVTFDTWKGYFESPPQRQQLYDRLRRTDPEMELIIQMGQAIPRTITGALDPQQVLFGTEADLMGKVYDGTVRRGNIPASVKEYLSIALAQQREFKILEIGAGTGAFTQFILECLTQGESDRLEQRITSIRQYVFTDISPFFFAKAKKRLQTWDKILTFSRLDIEQKPEEQGFSLADYDMVIASNVLHAAANITEALRNAHSMLKPGGKLLLHEGTRTDLLATTIVSGQLPGWWRSQDSIHRRCPFKSADEWDVALVESGFSGLDISMQDTMATEAATYTFMVTSANSPCHGNDQSTSDIVLISPLVTELETIALRLKDQLGYSGSCQVVSLDEAQSIKLGSSICVSLLELESPVLAEIDDRGFKAVQTILNTCTKVLWVTGDPKVDPRFSMATGLIRTVRWERDMPELNLTCLAICGQWADTMAQVICKVFRHQFHNTNGDSKNAEYLFHENTIYTNRLICHSKAQQYMELKEGHMVTRQVPWGSLGCSTALYNSTPGLLSGLRFETRPEAVLPLGDSEVEIEPHAVGLNLKDYYVASGKASGDYLGHEGSGLATAVGSNVKAVKPGERVLYVAENGAFANRVRVKEDAVIRIPEDMDSVVASGIPIIYCTAIHAFSHLGTLAHGARALIHAAAGDIGQAAVQYAQHMGADIFITVSSIEERDFLSRQYGILEDHIFSNRDLSFVDGVLQMTDYQGVDLCLSSSPSSDLQESLRCVAPFGYFIQLGRQELLDGHMLKSSAFLRNITFLAFDIIDIVRQRPRRLAQLLQEMLSLWRRGIIRQPAPLTVLQASEIEKGMRLLQGDSLIGKVVVKLAADIIVPVAPASPPPYNFQADASYVLAGGLGGIGRSLIQWMTSKGARNLIVLSRTGSITDSVQLMISRLVKKGCNVQIAACDITDPRQVDTVFGNLTQLLPPIKGCIQCSMALQDRTFYYMSHAEWMAATKPKVQGSLNLHKALPKDLDFFLMLSSVAGIIGNRSQGNYAAGNTFQDAFARALRLQGQHAASLDLGPVKSVGFVAENEGQLRLESARIAAVQRDQVHAMVEYLIDSRNNHGESTCQLVSGLLPSSVLQQRSVQPPEWLKHPIFTFLDDNRHWYHDGASTPRKSHPALLTSSTTLGGTAQTTLDMIQQKLCSLASMPEGCLDPNKSVRDNGIDSLIAMEFRSWISRELDVVINFTDIVARDSLLELSRKIAAGGKYARLS